MSTSSRHPNTIRQGGPGAAHENARNAPRPAKPQPDTPHRRHAKVSGGGGEADSHHSHDPGRKGGQPGKD